MDGDDTCALRERLILAAMGVAVAACHPVNENGPPSSAAGSASATASAKPIAERGTCDGGAAKEHCFRPFDNMRAVGTGQPGPMPPHSAYDANGCLPTHEVSDGCCNLASMGPRFTDGRCCYDICPETCCGRAFVVDGSTRVAATTPQSGWQEGVVSRENDGVGVAERAAAEAWQRDAQLEHASIASFGRFVLELLAVGAPASLVREAGEAMLDEVRHAELCFGLASRFGGYSVGPGPLSMEGALAARSLPDIAAAAVQEGCVGETIAALMASRQLERATDPAIRQVLERIASDEARHAELAFRFVRWALDTGDDDTRRRVESAFAAALRETRCSALTEVKDFEPLHAFGRLSAAEQDEVASTAKRAVLGPAVEILLGQRRLPS